MPMSSCQIALLAAACLLIVARQAVALSPTPAVSSAASSVPTSADANPRQVDWGPSFAHAMVIADSWVTGHGLVNTCAGKLQIRWEANPQNADGQIDGWSDGWVWTGEAFVWDTGRCQIGIRTGMSRTQTCGVLGHELMHAVRGAEHSGPLASTRTVPPACGMWKQRPRKLRTKSSDVGAAPLMLNPSGAARPAGQARRAAESARSLPDAPATRMQHTAHVTRQRSLAAHSPSSPCAGAPAARRGGPPESRTQGSDKP